jgi:short subunit dehydrogenase-like uncharacterized protein
MGVAIDQLFHGPSDAARTHGRASVYARVSSANQSAEAWLETREAYQFTALSAVRAVEKTLAQRPIGALTPALAFGADFVLEIEGSRRYDTLPR